MAAVSLKVNGTTHTVDADPTTPLLYILMDDLELNGPKLGCGLGQCGACTVLLDGKPARSCVRPLSAIGAAEVTTIEGLGTVDDPHPVQSAFIAEQAIQCGFCISGIMLVGKTFVDANPDATEAEIADSLKGVICRCYTQVRMVRALTRYQRGLAK